ncbi:L,D-transpeptidase family protein [Streptomyces sp. NBC_00199]|uniref:L,D-transpeptidase family protein n=1 Tax=Streptomyces sp. NBC_00199 TaxID=2975678 RepID=UPI00224E5651|nr:L,D-transpeptidase family protein [Streptomyces sp. NBC_00199]MCX5263907.1 L,D-transpeptidase family protein [Streptomyces sp. NBC_00199]
MIATPRRRPLPRPRAVLLAASLLLTGCGGTASFDGAGADGAPAAPAEVSAAPGAPAPAAAARTVPQRIPGLGPKTWSQVPGDARQAVVVTGAGKNSPLSTVVLYRRTAAGWQAGERWPAHNALRGWSDHHTGGDLRSPIGVYGLTDAGGLLPDPGTKLPYDHGRGFRSPGTGFEGESLEGSFDYVVAIDYNRTPGVSPLDWTRPLGAGRGGGIWLHVDHGGPTHGCVSVAERHMKELLRALDPALHPVTVMGDHASLAR